MASNVKEHLEKLQKRLNEIGCYNVYIKNIKKDEYYLLAKEKYWDDAVSTTLKKLKKYKDQPKYVITTHIKPIFEYINIAPEDNKIVGGPLRLSVTAYEVNDFKDSGFQSYKGRSQYIWYTKDNLSKRKFSFTDLIKAVKVVNEEKVTHDPFAIVTITDVLESYGS
jgi:hypothetical protein